MILPVSIECGESENSAKLFSLVNWVVCITIRKINDLFFRHSSSCTSSVLIYKPRQ